MSALGSKADKAGHYYLSLRHIGKFNTLWFSVSLVVNSLIGDCRCRIAAWVTDTCSTPVDDRAVSLHALGHGGGPSL